MEELRKEIESLIDQANDLYSSGDLDGAMFLYKESEFAFREIGDRDGLCRSLGSQANILKDRSDFHGALALHKEAELIYRELGFRDKLALSLANQALILGFGQKQIKAALSHVNEAYLLAVDHGDVSLIKKIEDIRSMIETRKGK